MFFDWLRRDRSWDVLRLTDVPEGGAGWELLEEAKRAGLSTGAWEALQSPYVPLPASREAFISAAQWREARNMPDRPHDWTARGSGLPTAGGKASGRKLELELARALRPNP